MKNIIILLLSFLCFGKANYLNTSNYFVPYFVSLPDSLGPMWDFNYDWWYHSGSIQTKNQNISLVSVHIRLGTINDVLSTFSIGLGYNNIFSSNMDIGYGFSNNKNKENGHGLTIETGMLNYYNKYKNDNMSSLMLLKYGIIGKVGSIYEIQINTNATQIFLNMTDMIGVVFEDTSGFVGNYSFEFAFPNLKINNGFILQDGIKDEIIGGNIWLDRQVIKKMDSDILYTGNWFFFTINNKTYVFRYIFPKIKNQWMVGSLINPPVFPTYSICMEYSQNSAKILNSNNYDFNILNYNDPNNSPHWTSPNTNLTYGNAWIVKLYNENYIIKTLYNNSEIYTYLSSDLMVSAFEGSINVYYNNDIIGSGFMEQMVR